MNLSPSEIAQALKMYFLILQFLRVLWQYWPFRIISKWIQVPYVSIWLQQFHRIVEGPSYQYHTLRRVPWHVPLSWAWKVVDIGPGSIYKLWTRIPVGCFILFHLAPTSQKSILCMASSFLIEWGQLAPFSCCCHILHPPSVIVATSDKNYRFLLRLCCVNKQWKAAF